MHQREGPVRPPASFHARRNLRAGSVSRDSATGRISAHRFREEVHALVEGGRKVAGRVERRESKGSVRQDVTMRRQRFGRMFPFLRSWMPAEDATDRKSVVWG